MRHAVVAITGAQGVGKTTLVTALAAEFGTRLGEGCVVLTGLGQAMRSRGVPIGQFGSLDGQNAFAAAHLRRLRQSRGQLNILDRCIVDHLAYVQLLNHAGSHYEDMTWEILYLAIKQIDAVLYLPIPEALARSSCSHESDTFRNDIDIKIRNIVQQFPERMHVIQGTLNERVSQSITLVNNVLAQ